MSKRGKFGYGVDEATYVAMVVIGILVGLGIYKLVEIVGSL